MSKKSLKETLSQWSGLPKPPHRLEPRQTQKAAAEVAKIWGTELSRKPADYDLKIFISEYHAVGSDTVYLLSPTKPVPIS